MLHIVDDLFIVEGEIEWRAIRARGAGGQKVNKTHSAVHLRFDVPASSLPEIYKARLLARAGSDQRITRDGVIVIKAQRFRSREANIEDARDRLAALIAMAGRAARKRLPTRPPRSARARALDDKKRRGRLKSLRGRGGAAD